MIEFSGLAILPVSSGRYHVGWWPGEPCAGQHSLMALDWLIDTWTWLVWSIKSLECRASNDKQTHKGRGKYRIQRAVCGFRWTSFFDRSWNHIPAMTKKQNYGHLSLAIRQKQTLYDKMTSSGESISSSTDVFLLVRGRNKCYMMIYSAAHWCSSHGLTP